MHPRSWLLLLAGAGAFVAPRPLASRPPTRRREQPRPDDFESVELRLDVTVLWCDQLARAVALELVNQPLKSVPGWTAADLEALWRTFTSGCALSLAYVAFGALGGEFCANAARRDGARGPLFGAPRTAGIAALAALAWQGAETLTGFGYAPPGDAGFAAGAGSVGTTVAGVAATMACYRVLSAVLPG